MNNVKIGVIGAGNVGTAFARRLVPAGHAVMLSYSLDEGRLRSDATRFGAAIGSPADAVRFADVVVLSVPWAVVPSALKSAGPLEGKILWDCTNALKPDLSGLAVGTTTSAGEIIQGLAKTARVVKGIPPFAELLHSDNPTLGGKPAECFVCGDDAEARTVVAGLMKALPASVIDAGPLENARYIEPACFLLVRLAYAGGMGARIGFELRRG
jgi:8-hydroxy-5-deazaflavin:NADPH oxidoreductase